ncbi:MAG: NFACT family protein [Halanaerobiales bacterium]|nr:NFACT family protein [Halanaerobiales bacterium]
MAFDGLVLYTLTQEFRDSLITARVDKIYQPDPDLITIALRVRGENLRLLFSINPQYVRVNFTKEKFINPPHPPTFCMLLRKYLTSGRVVEVSQPGFERILHITIQNLNENGEVEQYRLIAELMGRHSNLILTTQAGIILDGLKRIPTNVSRHREVLPGKPYIDPPKQDKANPLIAEEAAFKALLQLDTEAKLFKAIMDNYLGISPLIAKEITISANLNPNDKIKDISTEELDQLWLAFYHLFNNLQERRIKPTLIKDDKGKVIAFSCFALKQYENLTQISSSTMNELLANNFETNIKKQRLDQISGEIRKTIKNLIEKALKKYAKLQQQLDDAENADDYRINGEMLTANLHQLKKGLTTFTAINYYDPELKEITIELNPALSPKGNAKKYFKRYSKLKTSVRYVKHELAKLDEELEYFRNVELSIEQIESKADIEEIREELIHEGYMKENRKKTPNRHKPKSKPMKFKSSDEFDILVGRNNRQNDQVTKKIASRGDLWFHVKDIPGSHVVIRNHDRREIPERTILETATIAAYFSKARESTHVPVDYTLIKYVNKPKGAKPGMVFYENYQTITVNPDKVLIEKLSASN